MGNYAAGIVLYKPAIDRLKENLDAITTQVEKVYCYNNGLEDENAVLLLLEKYKNVFVYGDGKNVGMATALNRLVEQADKDNIEWVLTLDQDSVVCDGMIEALFSLTHEKDVAIICPLIEDIRRKNEKVVVRSETIDDVDFCITSGSFMNVKITKEIGGFDDYLFIGLVDNEICYRIKLNGYRIIRNNAVVLNHELGNLTPSEHERTWLRLGTILHSEIIKKLSYRREVSPMRLYYATRNMIYLQKKYTQIGGGAWAKRKLIINSVSSVLRAERKMNAISAIAKGIKVGNEKKVKPYAGGTQEK